MRKPTTFEPTPDPMVARDLVGYGEFPRNPVWPDGAQIAVNFNLNIEGGGESTLANGDTSSEGMLNDIGIPAQTGRRVPLVESVFEYGSRRGAWRLLDIFGEFSVAISILGVVRALEQKILSWPRPACAAGTRSSATAIGGSTMGRCLKKSSASTFGSPSTGWRSLSASGRSAG